MAPTLYELVPLFLAEATIIKRTCTTSCPIGSTAYFGHAIYAPMT